MEKYKMYIGNRWVPASPGKTYTVTNPATEEIIAEIPLGGKEDVDLAVKAAKEAFPKWSKLPQAERTARVVKISNLLNERADEFTRLDCLDHGTSINLARIFTSATANNLEFNAHAARAMLGDVIPIRPDIFHYFIHEPVGVCALIIPWNVPLMMIGAKLGAALSVGNTCVIKPPSIDSMAALKLGEIIEQCDLPPGTVNIITGPGGTVGEELCSHPDVDLISFTGSSETGKILMERASRSVKRLALELGGKNPFIVLEDVDIESTAKRAVACSFENSGQICASPGRYYIHESIYDEFLERYITAAKNFVVGDPFDEKTQMGPLVSAEHRDKVEGYIKKGIDEGATLALGGERPTEPPLNKGFYVMPTVFTDVTDNMTIAREEIFGPVACIMKFSSEEEVIKRANDNVFGLSASVWTRNTVRAMKIAKALDSGCVWINDHLTIFSETPWGGVKESGIGRENGVIGLEEYTRRKLVAINMNES